MLNIAILMGRLTSTPELKYTNPGGFAVTKFSIAIDRDYQHKGKEKVVDFLDVIAWRQTAEFVCKYFSKGQLIAIKGSIQTHTYTDTAGNKRKATEIVADEAHFADHFKKQDSGDTPEENE